MRAIAELSLDGGVLCLDFINTVSSRTSSVFRDYLYDFSRVLEWCYRLNLLDEENYRQLANEQSTSPEIGETVLKKYLLVRENLWKIFSSVSNGAEPPKDDIKLFSKLLSETLSKLRFEFSDDSYQLTLNKNQDNYYNPLDQILKSAYDLLTNEDKNRIKSCRECGWMFLDVSKNNTRQWCNPNSCGTVNRSRRYQKRKKTASNAENKA